jgi:hypothetical protein
MEKIYNLTESQVHRLVMESVKILVSELNELNPETYESYADERLKQGKPFKSFLGHKAARAERRRRGEDIPLVNLMP